VELHFQKGLAGAPPEAISATRQTATNPAVLNAFALAIVGGDGPPAIPGLADDEPNLNVARRNARAIATAAAALKAIVPIQNLGAYVAESSFFRSNWQSSY
jgi:hypothetical protein